MTPQLTDEELMGSYVAGDVSALDELFRRYAPPLISVLRRGLTTDEARDLLQETFLHLHRSRRDFTGDAKLRPWLFTIALNVKRQHLRAQRRRRELPLEPAADAIAAPSPPVDAFELAAQVQVALAEIGGEQREVIRLHWMEGLPFGEVAAMVGATVGAAKVRAHRGYRQLRELLRDVTGRGKEASREYGGKPR